MNDLVQIVDRLTAAEPAGVLATLVEVAGSSYRRAGARLLVTRDEQRIGSISGGCLEEDVIARSRSVSVSGRADLVTYDTTSENDLIWGVGLGCHGVVKVLLEKLPVQPAWATALAQNLVARRPTPLAILWQHADVALLGTRLAGSLPRDSTAGSRVFRQDVQPPPALTIFGAGDDVRPLLDAAKQLGWHVTVADPRAAFATHERFPLADRIIAAPATELVARANLEPDALAVVMTHHYIHDVPVLRALLGSPAAYVGLLGPRKRAERILADLAGDGAQINPEQLARFHAPVGLDVGAETPAEVALSILAEIQACRAGRDGRPLRLRTTPIHEC